MAQLALLNLVLSLKAHIISMMMFTSGMEAMSNVNSYSLTLTTDSRPGTFWVGVNCSCCSIGFFALLFIDFLAHLSWLHRPHLFDGQNNLTLNVSFLSILFIKKILASGKNSQKRNQPDKETCFSANIIIYEFNFTKGLHEFFGSWLLSKASLLSFSQSGRIDKLKRSADFSKISKTILNLLCGLTCVPADRD
ncbi:MAG: hypothetical protein ACUVRL_08480 [Candidatus Saccharicenans sp.]|uniref:hypothetical protein n=1 Tax=Candidatus Saccharicenans sp. TaxID=2819258 RepID=UPI00404B31F8